jgi:hypothetical protein
MPTENWLQASRRDNIKPVILMQVEDSAAEEILYTTRSDWEGSTTLTNIDTTSQVGDAIGQGKLTDQAALLDSVEILNPVGSRLSPQQKLGVTMAFPTDENKTVTLTVQLRSGSVGGTILQTVTESIALGPGTSILGGRGYSVFDFSFTLLTASTSYWLTGYVSGSDGPLVELGSDDGLYLIVPVSSSDCTLTTSTIDTGASLTNPRILSIDDTLETGASIVYTAFGGPADPPVNNLGTVVDGDSLTAYRHYRLQADFSSTTGGRGILSQFGLREGLFKWYGTEKDVPFRGVKPYLQLGGFGNLSTAIKLDKGISTTGQISAVLKWTDDTSDFISTRFLRGKDVQMLYGFKGLGLFL